MPSRAPVTERGKERKRRAIIAKVAARLLSGDVGMMPCQCPNDYHPGTGTCHSRLPIRPEYASVNWVCGTCLNGCSTDLAQQLTDSIAIARRRRARGQAGAGIMKGMQAGKGASK